MTICRWLISPRGHFADNGGQVCVDPARHYHRQITSVGDKAHGQPVKAQEKIR